MKSEYLNPKYADVVKTMKLELEKLKHQYKAENTTQFKKN